MTESWGGRDQRKRSGEEISGRSAGELEGGVLVPRACRSSGVRSPWRTITVTLWNCPVPMATLIGRRTLRQKPLPRPTTAHYRRCFSQGSDPEQHLAAVGTGPQENTISTAHSSLTCRCPYRKLHFPNHPKSTKCFKMRASHQIHQHDPTQST